MQGLPLSYITDGRQVMVAGPGSGGTITAAHVTFGRPLHGGTGKLVVPPGFAAAHGTVTRFTFVTASGTRIPVTTSSRTDVATAASSPSRPAGQDAPRWVGSVSLWRRPVNYWLSC